MRRTTLILALALASTACARNARPSAPGDDAVTVLRVENNGFLDLDVFVLRDVGDRLRLGFVNGNSTADLRIPRALVVGTGSLRFIAAPVGGRGAGVSEQITVSPGDTVVMTIPH